MEVEDFVQEVPSIQASWEEFQSFQTYVNDLEKSGIKGTILRPPVEWKPNFLKQKKIGLKVATFKQILSGGSGVYKCSFLRDEEILGGQFEAMYPKLPKAKTTSEVEMEFWKINTSFVPMIGEVYGESLFTGPNQVWNLSSLDHLFARTSEHYPVHRPMITFGSWRCCAPWQIEAANLGSVFYNHEGRDRIWYFLEGDTTEKFLDLLCSIKNYQLECKQPLSHKIALLQPKGICNNSNIRIKKLIQHPNEFAIIFPGTVYMNFNLGFNIIEKLNFITPSWIGFYTARTSIKWLISPCKCKEILNPQFNKKKLKEISDVRIETPSQNVVSEANRDFEKLAQSPNQVPSTVESIQNLLKQNFEEIKVLRKQFNDFLKSQEEKEKILEARNKIFYSAITDVQEKVAKRVVESNSPQPKKKSKKEEFETQLGKDVLPKISEVVMQHFFKGSVFSISDELLAEVTEILKSEFPDNFLEKIEAAKICMNFRQMQKRQNVSKVLRGLLKGHRANNKGNNPTPEEIEKMMVRYFRKLSQSEKPLSPVTLTWGRNIFQSFMFKTTPPLEFMVAQTIMLDNINKNNTEIQPDEPESNTPTIILSESEENSE